MKTMPSFSGPNGKYEAKRPVAVNLACQANEKEECKTSSLFYKIQAEALILIIIWKFYYTQAEYCITKHDHHVTISGPLTISVRKHHTVKIFEV